MDSQPSQNIRSSWLYYGIIYLKNFLRNLLNVQETTQFCGLGSGSVFCEEQ